MFPSAGFSVMKASSALASVLLALWCASEADAQSAKDCVTGTVTLAESVAGKIAPDGTLFVYVRETGRKEGPPTAVVSIRKPVYPQEFTLCAGDQMVAGTPVKPLSGRYRVYARHSLTGAPMTQEGFLGTSTGSDKAGIRAGDKVILTIDQPLAK